MKYLLIVFLSIAVSALAQNKVERPKLVVGIVVDQMRYDYVYRYWDKYGANGFKKMVNEGFFCKNTHYNYVPTYTGPGHASIYTGSTPSGHGIVANDWYNRETKRTIYCAEDASVKPVGGMGDELLRSPKNLLSTTITDELKLFTNKKAKVIGVSYKDRGAILPAGHLADAAYWMDKKTGSFVTTDFYMQQLPQWVTDFNAKKLAEKYLEQDWVTLMPIDKYTESTVDNTLYEGLFKGLQNPMFPYNLKELKTKNGGVDLIGRTPFGNSYIKDFALQALESEMLGMDSVTDFLAVSFSSTDLIGHQFGINSIEVEDTYLRLDVDLADMIAKIEAKVGKENVLFFLSADHGAAFNPNYLKDSKANAGYFDEQALLDSLKLFSLRNFGSADYIETFVNGQVYLNRNLLAKRWYPLNYFQQHLSRYILTFPGVISAVTSEVLLENNFNEGPNKYNQQGFNYKRSGDILINYESGWFEPHVAEGKMVESGTTHGAGYNYDTHVPLIWYGWHIPQGERIEKNNITDISATLTYLLNINLPSACTGSPIHELFKTSLKTSVNTNKPKNETKWNKFD